MPSLLHDLKLYVLLSQTLRGILYDLVLDDDRICLTKHNMHFVQFSSAFANVPAQYSPPLMLPMHRRIPDRANESWHKPLMVLDLPVNNRADSTIRIARQQGVMTGCIHRVSSLALLDLSVLNCVRLRLDTP